MYSKSYLDKQIDETAIWISKAASALKSFYNTDKGFFWRKRHFFSSKDEKNDEKSRQPTSTTRSFIALCEYLIFLLECDNPTKDFEETREIIKGVSLKFFKELSTNPNDIRASASNDINMFTDSFILNSIPILKNLEKFKLVDGIDLSSIENYCKNDIVKDNIEKLKEWGGGKITEFDEVHDFITLNIIRGLDAFLGEESESEIKKINDNSGIIIPKRVKSSILEQLAYKFSGISSKFDPPELIFNITLLNRFPTTDTPQLTKTAIKTIVESQSIDGSWPTSRFVSYEGKGMLHVSSYEVALTLTNLLFFYIGPSPSEDNEFICQEILKSLENAFNLLKADFQEGTRYSGWSNDHARRTGVLESWVTALILSFLLHYREVLLKLRQNLILKHYDGIIREKKRVEENLSWPDMVMTLRNPDWIDIEKINKISDPTEGRKLTKNLKRKIIEPIWKNWLHRPGKQEASFILYGSPGTRKTSLSIKLADALGWPLLILSPPNFLDSGGLTGFESRAAEIFSDLFQLRRVVILFDECEELFKRREKESQVSSRTSGAFITAGMLPRLQRLRDLRWVLFIVATNTTLESLDKAVIRRGRFDYKQELLDPELNAQLHYIKSNTNFNSNVSENIEKALSKICQEKSKEPNEFRVSFSKLDDFISELNRCNCLDNVAAIEKIFKSILEKESPLPLS